MTTMLLLAALLAVQDPISKDDVLRLTKEGLPEDVILQNLKGSRFELSVDDVVELKKAGVGDRVLKAMVSVPREITVENLSHKSVWVGSKDGLLSIRFQSGGLELRPGDRRLVDGAGELSVVVGGTPVPWRVRTPATLVFRGADTSTVEVVTVEVLSGGDRDVKILETKDNTPAPAWTRAVGPPPYHDTGWIASLLSGTVGAFFGSW